MSYINEALRKAQREKESNYAAYGNIIIPSSKNAPWPAKLRLLVGSLIVFILIMGGVALLNLAASKAPVAKPAALQAVVSPNALPGNAASGIPPVVVPTRPPEKAGVTILSANTAVTDKKTAVELPRASTALAEKKAVDDSRDIFNQAMSKQSEGKLAEAKELYRKVIKSSPRNIQALNNLGVIYMSQKNYKWAIIRLQDALAIKPDYVDAHYNLACLYSQKKDVVRSIHYLRAAVKLNPEVRQWAKNDDDLKELSRLPDFNNLMDGKDN
jgi:tetratricopeptide (TPR) repeat protein